jgi:hypothetical protein
MKFNKLTTATIKFINAWPVGVNLSFLNEPYNQNASWRFATEGFSNLNGVKIQNIFTEYSGGSGVFANYILLTIKDVNNKIVFDNTPLSALYYLKGTQWQHKFNFTPDFESILFNSYGRPRCKPSGCNNKFRFSTSKRKTKPPY